ncbi:MAG: formyltransferase family protein [Bacteroidota bacterium]
MRTLNLAIFYGNNLGTQILVSEISRRLGAQGHRLCFVHSVRRSLPGNAFEATWPEVQWLVLFPERDLYPHLDQQSLQSGARAWSPRQLAEHLGGAYTTVTRSEINSPALKQFLAQNKVDLGLSIRFPFRFRSETMAYFREGPASGRPFWNLHSAILPDYPGYAPMRWVMHHREPSASFTLHEIRAELDRGAIIDVRPQPVDYALDMASNLLALLPAAADMAVEAVGAWTRGVPVRTQASSAAAQKMYCKRLGEADRARMQRSGLKFVDVNRIKAACLQHFSRPDTVHFSELEALLAKKSAAGNFTDQFFTAP